MKIIAIINPASGSGQAVRKLPYLIKSLGKKIIPFLTEYPGHAEILAGQACREGAERIIAVGGDGTLSEVVNGLWLESERQLPSLGIIPFGTGCDYARNFDIGNTLTEQINTAIGDSLIPVSIGICSLRGMNEEPLQRVFVNVMGMGFDANVVKRFQRQRRYISGRAGYLLSALLELLRVKSYCLKGEIDGKHLETDVVLLAAGLGRCFGGGMKITPDASPDSESFQVVHGACPGRIELMRLFSRVYAGRHLSHPAVKSCYARCLKLTTEPCAYLEADGELIGRTPAEVRIYPAAVCIAAEKLRN